MRKILSAMLSLILLVSIFAGCARENEASASHDGAAQGGTSAQSGDSDDNTVPPLDEIRDEVLMYVREAGLSAGGDAETKIAELYGSGIYDAYSIFQELYESGMLTEEIAGGLLVLGIDYGKNYVYTSTNTYKCTAFTAKLGFIDPQTGNVTSFRTFSSEDTHSCSVSLNGMGFSTTQSLTSFSSDFTKMTATATMEDGAVHVGWIDESGAFTDVSAKVTSPSDFGGLISHYSPCFGPDNYFYFRDRTGDNVQVKRVPLDDLREEAVEVILEDVAWGNAPLVPMPDGTVVDDSVDWYYYDEFMEYPAAGYFSDWISPTECIGVQDDMIYRITLTGSKNIFHWDDEKTPLIPEIKGRENWGAVVSPDCESVAFLSRLTSGTDNAPYLYMVSADGGEPVKVDTNYVFTDDTYLVDWLPKDGETQTTFNSQDKYLVDIAPVQCDDAVYLQNRGIGQSITGELYAHHIYGQEAGASVTWELDGSFQTLTGLWSICYMCKNTTTSEAFEVYTDGVLAYTAPTLTGGDDPVEVKVDISGCKELKIVFTSGTGCGEFANVRLSTE